MQSQILPVPGLVPGIHVFPAAIRTFQDVNGRVKPGRGVLFVVYAYPHPAYFVESDSRGLDPGIHARETGFAQMAKA